MSWLLCLQQQNTDYHVLYTGPTFQAGITATFRWVLAYPIQS